LLVYAFSCWSPLYNGLFLMRTVLQESQVPYGYLMTDEQLWLAYVELQTGCMYLSDAISMRFKAGCPTVPMALLWLASQHTVKPKQLPTSGALLCMSGQSRPPKQPGWRHVAPPDDPKPGMTDAEPEETSHSTHPLSLILTVSPLVVEAPVQSFRAWSVAKVLLSKSAILTPQMQSQSCTQTHNFIQSTQSCKAFVFHACWGRAGSNLTTKRRLPTGWPHPWKALPCPGLSI